MKSRFRLKLEYKGASRDSLTWSRLREWVDALGATLKSECDVDPDQVVPIEVGDGCVAIELVGPRGIGASLRKVASKPLSADTPLAQVAKSNAAVISIATARGSFKPLTIAEPVPRPKPVPVHSRSSLVVFVERVGGGEPKVTLVLPNGDRWSVSCSEDLVRKLGPHVYNEVRASFEVVIDGATGQVMRRTIVSFEPIVVAMRPPITIPDEPRPGLEFASLEDFLEARHG